MTELTEKRVLPPATGALPETCNERALGATVAAVFGLAAGGVAAGSAGLFGDSYRRGLAWALLGVVLLAAWPKRQRIKPFFVALGTTISAFWILALNSWMQTPTGHEVVDGRFVVVDWWQVLFNPSFPYRFAHMLLASALTCAFLLAGLSAWQLLKGTAQGSAPRVLRVALTLAAVLTPLRYSSTTWRLNSVLNFLCFFMTRSFPPLGAKDPVRYSNISV